MNRLVYLFELDTAKNTRNDAEIAEFAIFNEIIKNGNKVVLSVNQFVDSRVMTAAMYDEESYKYVRRLFDDGALKVSLYADVCSVSQYVQNAIEKCLAKGRDGYVFNTLPVEANDTELLSDINSALKYSDLTVINNRLDEEYVKLRYESELAVRTELLEKIRKLKIVLRFLSLVLKLSLSAKGNNPAKPKEGRSFMEFMDEARDILDAESFRRRDINACKPLVLNMLNDALAHFEEEGLSEKQINRRTNWLKYIQSTGRNDIVGILATEIVHLCYNYAVQDTILGVSKQYDDYKFEETFKIDFLRRVNLVWVMHNRSDVKEETPEYRFFYPKQWKRAVSISGYNSDYHTIETVSPDNNAEERKNWYTLILKKFGITLGITAAYVAAFCLVAFIFDIIGNAIALPAVGSIVFNLIGILLFVISSVVLSTFTKIPNAFECAVGVVRHSGTIFNAAARNYSLRDKK